MDIVKPKKSIKQRVQGMSFQLECYHGTFTSYLSPAILSQVVHTFRTRLHTIGACLLLTTLVPMSVMKTCQAATRPDRVTKSDPQGVATVR